MFYSENTSSPQETTISAQPVTSMSQAGKPASKRTILLTGAAGAIGSAFFQQATDRYIFRLADRLPFHSADHISPEHTTMQLDLTNLEACQQACRGIDTIVHLAADPSPAADFTTSLLPNNIVGTYHILRAAKDQGCQRVVLASSLQVIIGHPDDVQVQNNTPLRPMNMYGVSKCFAESAASYFAYAEGLSCIAIRIGAYETRNDHAEWLSKNPRSLNPAAYVSPRDLNQLLMRCIEVPAVTFAIVDGISNNRFKRANLTPTRELLGYQPEDDGFEIIEQFLQQRQQS